MKRYVLGLLCFILVIAAPAFGQSTTVSATITDTGGQAWKQGTYTLTFRPSPLNPTGPYFWAGSPFSTQQSIAGHMDTSGAFSVSVPSNTSITPSGSTWDVQVCPISQGNTTCYTQQSVTITGATQSLSSSVRPPPALIDLAHPAYPFVMAYTNAEFPTAPMGGIYYDYTQAHYFLCTNVTPSGQAQWFGSCSTWKEFCLVGDGLCAAAPGNCPPNTFDTGIITEHPLGTCYDSSHLWWNDGTNKQVFTGGDGTTTVSSTVKQTFSFGSSNAIQDVVTTGFVIGDANNLWGISGTLSPELYIIGDGNNNKRNTTEVYLFGPGNAFSDAIEDLFALGVGNVVQSTVSSTQVSIQQGFHIGENNLADASPGASLTDFGTSGSGNLIHVRSSKSASNVFLHGISNTATLNSQNDHDLFALGSRNTFEDTLNLTEQAMSLGFSNDINGANSTAQTLGLSNTLHNVSITSGNTVVVGSLNAATNLGTIAASYAESFGHVTNLHDCSDCLAIGANVNESTNHTMGIGMSSTPGIVVSNNGGSNDNVLRSPLAFASLPACSGNEGSFAAINNSTTQTQGATITGGGAFHVFGYCNGTNWIVVSGGVNANPAILAAPTVCNLGSDITSIPSTTPQTVINCSATAPSSGCPCRAIVAWSIIGDGTSATEQATAKVSDGTTDFGWAAANLNNQISSGYQGVNRTAVSPNTYTNGQSVIFTLTAESDHTWNIRAVSTFLSAPTQVQVTYLSSN